MNFEATDEILEALKIYFGNTNIVISTENKDYKGRKIKSDVVTIDEKNNIGFEVFDNEIIVFYFTDHLHFEDYTSDLEPGQDDYIKRVKVFLVDIFENTIKYVEIYKGKRLSAEKYFIVRLNSEENISSAFLQIKKLLNPFAKKTIKTTYFRFDKTKGIFEKI